MQRRSEITNMGKSDGSIEKSARRAPDIIASFSSDEFTIAITATVKVSRIFIGLSRSRTVDLYFSFIFLFSFHKYDIDYETKGGADDTKKRKD